MIAKLGVLALAALIVGILYRYRFAIFLHCDDCGRWPWGCVPIREYMGHSLCDECYIKNNK